ncbi:MAG: stage II sporulation protein R [Oscillospiraceae bacterium]
MKLKIWEIALIIAVIAAVLSGAVIGREAGELSEKLIRLHVVANSDTDADQELKLMVRDTILSELETELAGVNTREEAEQIIEENLDKLIQAAETTVREQGYNYSVTAAICEESFPTTEYDTFSLPAGVYCSLRIVIGEGAGHNWWCVVFPPVCSAASMDEAVASAVGLTGDEVSLITEENEGYVIKFKIMELLGKLRSVFE